MSFLTFLFGSSGTINLIDSAIKGILTVEEVNGATKEKLEEDNKCGRCTVLYLASMHCGVEVIEAILDKNVNIDGLSHVSIVDGNYYQVMGIIKLTLFNNELLN
jgi:hypothetical protein